MESASWIQRGLAWCLDNTPQASLLLLAVWVIDRTYGRRMWPQCLSVLWMCALARCCIAPDWHSPFSVSVPAVESLRLTAQPAWSGALARSCAGTWLAGAVTMLVLRQWARVRLLRQLVPQCPGAAWQRAIERSAARMCTPLPARVGCLPGLDTPAVAGLVRPLLLLPESALARQPRPADLHALMHELAHLRRLDAWRDEALAVLRALLWFNPLVWIATARLHALAERACDQAVARALGRGASAYRRTLIRAATRYLRPEPHLGVYGFALRRNDLIERIEQLERVAPRSLLRLRLTSALLGAFTVACVLPMSPRSASLRRQARDVFAAQSRGERQSCFVLRAAGMLLADPR